MSVRDLLDLQASWSEAPPVHRAVAAYLQLDRQSSSGAFQQALGGVTRENLGSFAAANGIEVVSLPPLLN